MYVFFTAREYRCRPGETITAEVVVNAGFPASPYAIVVTLEPGGKVVYRAVNPFVIALWEYRHRFTVGPLERGVYTLAAKVTKYVFMVPFTQEARAKVVVTEGRGSVVVTSVDPRELIARPGEYAQLTLCLKNVGDAEAEVRLVGYVDLEFALDYMLYVKPGRERCERLNIPAPRETDNHRVDIVVYVWDPENQTWKPSDRIALPLIVAERPPIPQPKPQLPPGTTAVPPTPRQERFATGTTLGLAFAIAGLGYVMNEMQKRRSK